MVLIRHAMALLPHVVCVTRQEGVQITVSFNRIISTQRPPLHALVNVMAHFQHAAVLRTHSTEDDALVYIIKLYRMYFEM